MNNPTYHKIDIFLLLDPDCSSCISEFDNDGGCTCLENPSCDPVGLVPEGCYQCSEKAMEFCRAGNFIDIWSMFLI